MDFIEKLEKIVNKNNSLLCVGLDIDSDKMPKFLFEKSKNPYLDFNKRIINSTKDLVCAYKLNMAFYEVLGRKGYDILNETIKYIPKDIIVILDGKRNDIGNTARKYAKTMYETYSADAVTVNPYLGFDSVKPFIEYENKCCFILCRTSNSSAGDFQNLYTENRKLFEHVALKIKEWNKIGLCGAVVGATYPDELKKIRQVLGDDIPLLIPGIGKQGGDIEKTVKNGTNKEGLMAIINSSRGIIYAGNNEDYAEKAGKEALILTNLINNNR